MIFLGIDCGTQSTKTVAVDAADGRVLAHASSPYDVIEGLPAGHMEQHPKLWVDAMDATVAQVLAKLGNRRREVAGIGISGQQHGFVPLDKEGAVIRPAKLWCDTSTAAECDEFRAKLGGKEALLKLIGNDMLPGWTAPKILWLKNKEPHNFARLAHILLPHDYLNYHLTGAFTMEYGDASGTALLDVRTREWSEPVLDAIAPGLADKLPVPGSSKRAAGVLKSSLAKQWNLPEGVIISAGGGDNMMGAIGTGNTSPGVVTGSLGTSGTIFACASEPIIDPDGEIAAFCDSTDAWMPLLCTMNVTVATETFRDLFAWPLEELEAAVTSVPAGANGLLFLPYLQGERTPNLPNATGVLHGMRPGNTTPAHLARAAMEGATLGLAYGLQRLRALGLTPSEIRLTGGGSKSPAWRQLCADVFNCQVVTMSNSEGAALGAALQALATALSERTIAEWTGMLVTVNEAERAEPNASNHAIYAALLEKQTALTRCLAGCNWL
ncbi:xylulokinase [Verrucomicrobia bacterium LW23]|nr:xylulokinase [Verrucomicrobia bacterium LW23]